MERRCPGRPEGGPGPGRGSPAAPDTRVSPLQVNEVCSPTKPAAPFSPESWYRKAYEESRAGSRPTPEGAGSALGSSGTPSPGSGTSSPSSFTGSPGPASPGIGTSSPGSLGGSPGFGTGSPGSGSGGGSSPGSDRGVWCENCNARLVELKRQALKLLLPGPFPGKVSAAGDGTRLGGPPLRAPRRGQGRGWGGLQRQAMLSCRRVVGSAGAAPGLGGQSSGLRRQTFLGHIAWMVRARFQASLSSWVAQVILPASLHFPEPLSVPPALAQLSGWTRAVPPFPETLVPRVSTDLSRVLGRGQTDTSCWDSAPSPLPPYHSPRPMPPIPPLPSPH